MRVICGSTRNVAGIVATLEVPLRPTCLAYLMNSLIRLVPMSLTLLRSQCPLIFTYCSTYKNFKTENFVRKVFLVHHSPG